MKNTEQNDEGGWAGFSFGRARNCFELEFPRAGTLNGPMTYLPFATERHKAGLMLSHGKGGRGEGGVPSLNSRGCGPDCQNGWKWLEVTWSDQAVSGKPGSQKHHESRI